MWFSSLIFPLYAMVQYLGSCAILWIAVLILYSEHNSLILGSRVGGKVLVLRGMLALTKPQVLMAVLINLKMLLCLPLRQKAIIVQSQLQNKKSFSYCLLLGVDIKIFEATSLAVFALSIFSQQELKGNSFKSRVWWSFSI